MLLEIDQRKQMLLTITPAQLSHIGVCKYSINNTVQNYCSKDQAELLRKKQSKISTTSLIPRVTILSSAFIDVSYPFFLLGKLDLQRRYIQF